MKRIALVFLGLSIAGAALVVTNAPGKVVAQIAEAENLEIAAKIEKDGCAFMDEGKVEACRFDYEFGDRTIEAISFRPSANGKYSGMMLIPGYQGTPQKFIGAGRSYAKAGFAAMAVGTPGFGKTNLEPDFIGENTVNAYIAGFEKFRKQPFVNADKMAIFGYLRGAMAASLMLPKLKTEVKAAVLGGGVYDLKKVYETTTLAGVKENIRQETGATEEAFKQRSAIYQVKEFEAPVLIVHGGKDVNAPVEQAYLLRDELRKNQKEFELKIFEDRDHKVFRDDFLPLVFEFLARRLKDESITTKPQ